jgi:hypothetical protein
MAHYRCYFLNDAGSIRSFETFECATDQEAIEVARVMFEQRSHFHGFEVWLRDRQVHVEQAAPTKEGGDGAR